MKTTDTICSHPEPLQRLQSILRYVETASIGVAERNLSLRVPQLRSFSIKTDCFGGILCIKSVTKIETLRCQFIVIGCLRGAFFNAVSAGVSISHLLTRIAAPKIGYPHLRRGTAA
jgi:hypothetical protein